MKTLIGDLAEAIARVAPAEGPQATCVPGVYCSRFSSAGPPRRNRWRACVAVVAQGCKEVSLGPTPFRCEAGQYTATPVVIPVTSQVVGATTRTPFLALLVELDPRLVNEVAAQIDSGTEPSSQIFFRGQAERPMLECALRLARLLSAPNDARALAPLVIRELIYHLLNGAEGAKLREFVRSGTLVHRIARAMHDIRSALEAKLDIEDLARRADMSRSAFFKHFRAVAQMSPVQYQKRLRLHEARRLMIEAEESAESAAYAVGYNSASQFSREYARLFGRSPARDVSARDEG